MIKTIIHLLDSSDISKLIICLCFSIYFILLVSFRKKFEKDSKRILVWKLLCFIPLLISIIHFFIFCMGSAITYLVLNYIYIYLLALLIALFPAISLIPKQKIVYIVNIVNIVIISLVSLLSFYSNIYSGITINYSHKSLSNAYISLCDYLKKNYIMSDWKQIDYDTLKQEGLLLVNEAEKTGNINKYFKAVDNLINSLYDGHSAIFFYNNDNTYTMNKLLSYNDYGLVLIKIDNGDTIAVLCDDNIEIKNGYKVTKWNNIPINEAVKNVKSPISESVLENEDITNMLFLAGTGGDTVEVTYLDSNNQEKVATLNKLNNTIPRALTARRYFFHNFEDDYGYKMLTNDIGYMRVLKEESNYFSDYLGYLTGNHTFAREMFRKDLRKLKAQGMTKLVLDIRNNGGGYDEVSIALTSLFTKEKMFAYSLGVKNGNNIKSVKDIYVYGDGEFSDLEIIVLTNMNCGSAGDGLVLYLSRLPNVTVAGITNPSGINQETGGRIYLPKGIGVNFPTGVILDENGDFNIDTDYTRKSRTPVDIKIPLTKESVLKIFNGEDYELDWAIQQLNG